MTCFILGRCSKEGSDEMYFTGGNVWSSKKNVAYKFLKQKEVRKEYFEKQEKDKEHKYFYTKVEGNICDEERFKQMYNVDFLLWEDKMWGSGD